MERDKNLAGESTRRGGLYGLAVYFKILFYEKQVVGGGGVGSESIFVNIAIL